MTHFSKLKLVTNQNITPRVIFRKVMSRPRSRKQILSALQFCFEPAEKLLVAYAARLGDELCSLDSQVPLFETCIVRATTAYRNVPPEPLAGLQTRVVRAILNAIIESSAEAFSWHVTGRDGHVWNPMQEDYLSFCAKNTLRRIHIRAMSPHDAMESARALMRQLSRAVGAEEPLLAILPELKTERGKNMAGSL